MIYTCTLNPAIDYRLEVEDLKLGSLNRASFNKLSAGGKGINVSIVLKALGVESIALGFLGGFTGIYLTEYLSDIQHLNLDFTTIKAPTRINVKLASEQTTEVNALAPHVTKEELKALLKKIDSLKQSDVLILAGSSIKADINIYEAIAKKCSENNITFIADTENDNLRRALAYKPYLVKPNIHELESYYKASINNERSLIHYGRLLLKEGAKNVIVSCGKEGAYFINMDAVYYAKGLKGEALNPVGAGDSVVAGFVAGIDKNLSIKEAFALAVASGSATAFSYDLATKEEIDAQLKQVKIDEVSYENRSID